MKVVISIVLVLFGYITIGDVDAIQCYESACGLLGDRKAEDCKDSDDFGKLVDCEGYCYKDTVLKTGEFFLIMNNGLACTALSVN